MFYYTFGLIEEIVCSETGRENNKMVAYDVRFAV